ncbi:hypothetical protein [Tenacibaculum xiamenense]|uniref:hypothetical protein n=1 Tax=Tenacibaculum xiamenense TaxID=1261553 RepID=UPI00389429A7
MGKKDEYQERHRFWTDKTLTQYGFANNFFLVAAIGILAFVLKEIEADLQVTFSLKYINWKITLLRFSALSAFISICCGTITVLSRLYDLRLTRHIINTRIKALDKGISLNDDYISINNVFLLSILVEVMISKNYFIKKTEIVDSDILHPKFFKLRKKALVLGRLSWRYFSYQIIILVLSVMLFMLGWMI